MIQAFTLHSADPYERHSYKLYLKNGKTIIFDDYEAAQVYWFSHCQIPDYLDVIEVLDKSKRKEKVKASGFAN
jgi:hypothetical protein